MGNLFGVEEGIPLVQWPSHALERLKEGFGRNGQLTEAQQKTEAEAISILADRAGSGVDYTSKGELAPRV